MATHKLSAQDRERPFPIVAYYGLHGSSSPKNERDSPRFMATDMHLGPSDWARAGGESDAHHGLSGWSPEPKHKVGWRKGGLWVIGAKPS